YPACFDKKKLEWINNQYMKDKDSENVFEMTNPHMQTAGLVPETPSAAELSCARDYVALYQEQMTYVGEIVPLSELFFREHLDFTDEAKEVLNGEQVPTVMTELIKQFESLEPFDEPAEIKKSIKAVQKETGVKGKQLFMPIRVAVTGQTHGPELPNTIALLGRDKVLSRLKRII